MLSLGLGVDPLLCVLLTVGHLGDARDGLRLLREVLWGLALGHLVEPPAGLRLQVVESCPVLLVAVVGVAHNAAYLAQLVLLLVAVVIALDAFRTCGPARVAFVVVRLRLVLVRRLPVAALEALQVRLLELVYGLARLQPRSQPQLAGLYEGREPPTLPLAV